MYDILLFVVTKRALHVSRRVGMADDADSKSVGSNPVWVQVPPPASDGAKLNCDGSGFAPFCVLESPVKSRFFENI